MLWIGTKYVKANVFASLALAFASFGDAFLYPFLPVSYGTVGVPVAWVGVLLSVNRFARIVSNSWMVRLFATCGLRVVMISASLIAVMVTAGYFFATSVIIWIILRLCWGIAFSAMRIGTLAYSVREVRPGFALGISKSIQDAGPLFTLLITPVLLTTFNAPDFFLVLSIFSLPAIYFALNLPISNDRTQPSGRKFQLRPPSTVNYITLISAIVIDGMLVIVLGVVFMRENTSLTFFSAAAMASIYLAYRRICMVVLAPIGGWVADVLGIDVVFKLSICFVVTGLVMVACGLIDAGIIVVFTFYAVNVTVTPGAVAKGEAHPLSAVAENATWRDLGAAAGTLGGGFLITSDLLQGILLISIFTLMIFVGIHILRTQRNLKTFMTWK